VVYLEQKSELSSKGRLLTPVAFAIPDLNHNLIDFVLNVQGWKLLVERQRVYTGNSLVINKYTPTDPKQSGEIEIAINEISGIVLGISGTFKDPALGTSSTVNLYLGKGKSEDTEFQLFLNMLNAAVL